MVWVFSQVILGRVCVGSRWKLSNYAQELKKAEFVGGSIERAARGRVAMFG